MDLLRWTIGKVEVSQVVELEAGRTIQETVNNAAPENIKQIEWLYPHFADAEGNLKALVQSFLVKSAGRNILIDTCNGNSKKRTDITEWSNLRTNYLENLRNTSIAEEDIDLVLCTHLHCDHVGWNTKLVDGEWVPTFPNARYLFVQKEYDYWKQKPEKEIDDDKAAFDDSVEPIVKAGLAELIEADHQIDQNIRLMPTPGQTPGHVSVSIESDTHSALITGDLIYHPCQIARPKWTAASDTDPKMATAYRKEMLAEIVDTDTLLIGSHFPNPVAGRVISYEDGYAFKIEE